MGPPGRLRRGRGASLSERWSGLEDRREEPPGRPDRPRGSERDRRGRDPGSRRSDRVSADPGRSWVGSDSDVSEVAASGWVRTRRRRTRRGRLTFDSSIIPRPYPLDLAMGSRGGQRRSTGAGLWTARGPGDGPGTGSCSKRWETTGSRVGTGLQFNDCPRQPANAGA